MITAFVLSGFVSARTGFDGNRAFRELVALVQLGPRPAGSPANREAQQIIATRFRQAGWATTVHGFEIRDDSSRVVDLGNVVARRPGTRGDLILVATHHDTARLGENLAMGANDGASGPALLLELARQLGPSGTGSEIWIVSCDGSHALEGKQPREHGFHGSRELLRLLAREGRLRSIRAMLAVDRVADRDLGLTPDARVSGHLQDLMLSLADRLGVPLAADPRPRIVREIDRFKLESEPRFRIHAEHVPFFEAGVNPILAIVDGVQIRTAEPEPLGRSDQDDLAGVSADSITRVGNLVLELVWLVDSQPSSSTPKNP